MNVSDPASKVNALIHVFSRANVVGAKCRLVDVDTTDGLKIERLLQIHSFTNK